MGTLTKPSVLLNWLWWTGHMTLKSHHRCCQLLPRHSIKTNQAQSKLRISRKGHMITFNGRKKIISICEENFFSVTSNGNQAFQHFSFDWLKKISRQSPIRQRLLPTQKPNFSTENQPPKKTPQNEGSSSPLSLFQV